MNIRTTIDPHPSRLKAELALAFCTFLWGSTFVVVKSSLDQSSVFVFLALRFTLAGFCMTVFRPGILRALKREEIFAGIRLGFFMFGGYAFQTAIRPLPIRVLLPAPASFWFRSFSPCSGESA